MTGDIVNNPRYPSSVDRMKSFNVLSFYLLTIAGCHDSLGDATVVDATTEGPDATATTTSEPTGDATSAFTTGPTGDATTAPTTGPTGDATTAPMTEPMPTTGSTVCDPGDQDFCYSGPFVSHRFGLCAEGLATCLPDGSGFGPCEGEVIPQPEDCDSPDDENCDGLPGCPTGTELWSKRFGDDYQQGATGVAISSGDTIVTTGYFSGTIDLGGGPLVSTVRDTYLAKFDSAGNHIWSKAFGGEPGFRTVEAVCSDDAGNLYITGSFRPDIYLNDWKLDGILTRDSGFIAKFDPAGATLWAKAFVPTDESQDIYLTKLDCDTTGALVGTAAQDGVDFGGGLLAPFGGFDLVVARFDAAGAHVWSRRFGDAEDQDLSAIALAPNGDAVLCGHMEGAADFGGGPLASAGSRDVFVARLGPAGDHVWSARHGAGSSEQCNAVVVDVQGAVVIAGDYSGVLDLGGGTLSKDDGGLFLAKFAADGAHQWSRGFGEAFLAQARNLTTDAAANIYLTGDYINSFDTFDVGLLLPVSIGYSVYVAKYGGDGTPQWARAYGGDGDTLDGDVAVDSVGDVVLTGRFDGAVDFGKGTHVSAGNFDVFLAKIRIE